LIRKSLENKKVFYRGKNANTHTQIKFHTRSYRIVTSQDDSMQQKKRRKNQTDSNINLTNKKNGEKITK